MLAVLELKSTNPFKNESLLSMALRDEPNRPLQQAFKEVLQSDDCILQLVQAFLQALQNSLPFGLVSGLSHSKHKSISDDFQQT